MESPGIWGLFVGNCQFCATFGPTVLQDPASRLGGVAFTEAVVVFSFSIGRLKRSFSHLILIAFREISFQTDMQYKDLSKSVKGKWGLLYGKK